MDLATHDRCLAVLTLVAHPMYTTGHRALRAPWSALVAKRDSVFPKTWAKRLLYKATHVEYCAGDHWVSNRVARAFFKRQLTNILQATADKKS